MQSMDDCVRRWYLTLARSSMNTANVRLKHLMIFCRLNNIKASDMLAFDKYRLKNMIIDHLNWMQEQGYSNGYQESILKAIKSWLRFNDISIDIPFRHDIAIVAKSQMLPSDEEYKHIISNAELRARATIALVSKSGLRLQVLGNYNASDGLKIRDIPDIIISNKPIATATPCLIKVRAELSKNRKPYITFLSKQGVKYLLAYLNDRLKKGEVLNDDSPIIASSNGKHISTLTVSKIIRKHLRRLGYNIRPYDLRHWFATRLEVSGINDSIREALMGHISGIKHHYTYAKHNLAKDLINALRYAYASIEHYIDVEVGYRYDETEELKNRAYSIIRNLDVNRLKALLLLLSSNHIDIPLDIPMMEEC